MVMEENFAIRDVTEMHNSRQTLLDIMVFNRGGELVRVMQRQMFSLSSDRELDFKDDQ